VPLSRPLLDLLLHRAPNGPALAEGELGGGTGQELMPHSGGGAVGGVGRCVDTAGAVACRTWAELGECEDNAAFMRERCHRACGCK
jgi:hypothetical protein